MADLSRNVPKQEVPTKEQIAQRAYELYQQRGCEPGREVEDWLAAENELRNQNVAKPAAPQRAERASAVAGSRQRTPKSRAATAFESSKAFDNSKLADSHSKEF